MGGDCKAARFDHRRFAWRRLDEAKNFVGPAEILFLGHFLAETA